MKRILVVVCLSFIYLSVVAQQNKTIKSGQKNTNKGEGERKALIIGNQKYKYQSTLGNVYNDADSMEVALNYIGFKNITKKTDITYSEFLDVLDMYIEDLKTSDVAFVYYSGHGLGLNNDNWLLPTDFNADCLDQVRNRAISVEKQIRKKIQEKNVRNLFLVIDACRNEAIAKKCPNKSSIQPSTQLVDIESNPSGFLQAFATDYGKEATYLSYNGYNSLFTESLLLFIRKPLEINDIFRKAGFRTIEKSKELNRSNPQINIQEPIINIRIYEDFYFLKPENIPLPPDLITEANNAFNNKNFDLATNLYKQLANEGNTQAQSKLGFMHLNGLGIDKNITTATYYYKSAAINVNGYDVEAKKYMAVVDEYNEKLRIEKRNFINKKLIKTGELTLGAATAYIGGKLIFNSIQREADAFNSQVKLWDKNNDGFMDLTKDEYNQLYVPAKAAYDKKSKQIVYTYILQGLSGVAILSNYFVLKKRFDGVKYNFGVGYNGQQLTFTLKKPL